METEQRIGIVNAQDAPAQKVQGFAKTLEFLKRALAEGAHLKTPQRVSEDQWIRQRNVVGVYFGSPAIVEQLGDIYGVTKQMVRLIKNNGMRNLWKNCSSETQILFPFQELVLKKPLPQRLREGMSLARGGKTILIRDQIEAGMSIDQIKESGVSMQNITASRIRLEAWGMGNLPYINTRPSQNLELERKLITADTDEDKQELLNQVKRGLYQNRIKGENPLLTTLTSIALEVGLSLGFQKQNMKIFITSLKNAKFPMGEIHEESRFRTGEEIIQRYNFILTKDKERAKEILLSDPNLQRFRRS